MFVAYIIYVIYELINYNIYIYADEDREIQWKAPQKAGKQTLTCAFIYLFSSSIASV